MEAFATVKQPQFFISESLESSDENIDLHYVLKSYKEHGRFNRAITMVADAALDSDGCLRLFVLSVCIVCLYRLFVSSVCIVCLRLFVYIVSYIDLSFVLSVYSVCLQRLNCWYRLFHPSSVCIVCLNHMCVMSVFVVCLYRLFVSSVCIFCLFGHVNATAL